MFYRDYLSVNGQHLTEVAWGHVALAVIAILLLTFLFFSSLFEVEQQERALVERFGKYRRIAGPGLGWKLPFPIDRVVDRLDMRLTQVVVEAASLTKDKVTLGMKLAVQYRPIEGKEYDAFYRLEDEEEQITSFVNDAARSKVPTLDLAEVYERQGEIASQVQRILAEEMDDYGYEIISVPIVELIIDEKVEAALNEVQAQTALRQAAEEKGKGQYILRVKEAEAEAEAKALAGSGIARERAAIAKGLAEAVSVVAAAGGAEIDREEVFSILLLTQYFDALKAIGMHNATILVPHSPAALGDLKGQIREALLPLRAVLSPETPTH